ncbi:hypothetical protein PanWU01x14_280440 [Parasponia andersonii]|uniref:Uncharacterized protein n=1 Tax=Parasponia andersonii TaxID=3476 RepID=A0A2P5B1F9_PARAD|nr:hypothetical protein PanWU01x14_280440 [Parasponia andersonii]
MSSVEILNVTLPVNAPPKTLNTIVEWKESLALLISDINCLSIEIWVMDDSHGGVEASGPNIERLGPSIMFWKSDEPFLETRDGRIVSYNLGTQKVRALPNPICGVSPQTCVGDIFMQTLVLVKGRN